MLKKLVALINKIFKKDSLHKEYMKAYNANYYQLHSKELKEKQIKRYAQSKLKKL